MQREEVQQLREKVARAEAAKCLTHEMTHAATSERSKLQSCIEEQKERVELLDKEKSQLEKWVAEHEVERCALNTENQNVEEQKRLAERRLAEKSRRSMISRACFQKKLRGEREAKDKLQNELSEQLNRSEALHEGNRLWEQWAYALQQERAHGTACFASAFQAHFEAQPGTDLAQSDLEELKDAYHLEPDEHHGSSITSFPSVFKVHPAGQPEQYRAHSGSDELKDVYHLDPEDQSMFRAPPHRVPQ